MASSFTLGIAEGFFLCRFCNAITAFFRIISLSVNERQCLRLKIISLSVASVKKTEHGLFHQLQPLNDKYIKLLMRSHLLIWKILDYKKINAHCLCQSTLCNFTSHLINSYNTIINQNSVKFVLTTCCTQT